MLPEEKLQTIIGSEFSPEDATGWKPSWLVRYSEFYKTRGVVRSKGYTLYAERSIGENGNTNGSSAATATTDN